jgi:DNA-binding transcriptional MerR regulator
MLLKIKEFADFCELSVRALHLYDRMNLFHPVKTDENGYRYYDTDQMKELNTIISFKKVGFSLKDISEMKKNNFSREDVILQLNRKLNENKNQIEILSYGIENINTMLNNLSSIKTVQDENQEAMRVSRIVCFENDKMERDFSQILWL